MSKRFGANARTHSTASRGHHEPDQTSIPLFTDSDFLPPEQKFNNEWWIGRPVKEDGVVGFVPSPVNLETILIRREVQARKAAKALAKYASLLSVFSFGLAERTWKRALTTKCNAEAHVVF